MNAKFEYLYRDAGNYKKWGDVVFKNRDNVDIDLLESMLISVLIENEFFEADKSGLPKLSFQELDKDLDHDWYEYSSLKKTTEQENDIHNRDIIEFIKSLK